MMLICSQDFLFFKYSLSKNHWGLLSGTTGVRLVCGKPQVRKL